MAKWCTLNHAQVVYLEPCPSGVPWCMTTTWSTTYVVEKCDVMWKLPHPVLSGGSERVRKVSFYFVLLGGGFVSMLLSLLLELKIFEVGLLLTGDIQSSQREFDSSVLRLHSVGVNTV
ncbi:hypothetical protein AVEN_34503-1 [Araneus ventricosus]|uniref:Uncharacterized protein n=1 Tax=Araneus ventricosus TaxID=182803 RepID=A0A4Y2MSU9_ARAVE|nr:hypothetical protein AVEN_34503-1 [Araneus ventricosus]